MRTQTRRDVEREGTDPGIAWLLTQLSHLLGDDQPVHLCYDPPVSSSPTTRWQVWLGAPAGSGGSRWGAGETPSEALHAAYTRIVESIFTGRVDPYDTSDDG